MRRRGSGAEPFPARALVQVRQLVGAGGAVPVADAVIAGEVRARLCRSDEVVAGDAVLDRTWQATSPISAPRLSAQRDRLPPPPTLTPGSIPSASFSSVGTPMRTPSRLSAVGSSTGSGSSTVVESQGSRPGDDRVEERAVPHGLRQRADLIEAGREGDDAVPRDGAVGRPEADDAAQRGGLLDRAARVRAERPGREAPGDGRRRASRGPAGHASRIPGVRRWAVGRVLGRRAHGELVHVRLAEQGQAGRLAAWRRPSSRRRARSPRGSSSRRSSATPSVVMQSLSAIGTPGRAVAADDVQVRVELRVPLVDRREVGGAQLGSRRPRRRSSSPAASSAVSLRVSITGSPFAGPPRASA